MKILNRVNKFILGTWRGQKYVRVIRLDELRFSQLKLELEAYMGMPLGSEFYFCGVKIIQLEEKCDG